MATRIAVLIGTATIGMAWAPRAADAATPRCRGEEVTINTATAGNDVIVGTPDQDIINGLGGDDIITGIGGDDIICGAEGNDIITTGDDVDTVIGGPGNDTLKLGAGDDWGFGGTYSDTMSISTDDGDDYIDGGPGDEQALVGDNAVNALNSTASGHGGNDTIVDADGATLVVGGHWSHFYIASGYDGGDKINVGGIANAWVVGDHLGSNHGVWVSGPANDDITTGGGNDTVMSDGFSNGQGVSHGGGVDHVSTGNGDDTMYGGPAVDNCSGGNGTDKVPFKDCEIVSSVP
ncbi:MAG TPA: calcium-binding protein [Acidimicrobiales bacterium]|nr:calcium-binding protein [Acidimicrobiales bacterium]